MADSKNLSFSKSPILKIFLRKFHGSVGLIDAKGIDVAQLALVDFSGPKGSTKVHKIQNLLI